MAPEVMVMKDELAELRSFKTSTTPAATTGAAHPGKRARVQQDRLPEIALFRGAVRSIRYFQFRGEGETVRELSVSNRAGQEIFINTMSVARSQASVKQEPSKSKCKSNEASKSNEPSTSTSECKSNEPSTSTSEYQEQRAKVREVPRATSQGTGIVKSNEPRRYGNCQEQRAKKVRELSRARARASINESSYTP